MILTTPQSVSPVHLFFGAPGLTSSYLVSLMHLARNTAEENKQTHSLHAVSLHASCVSFHAVFVFPGTAHCPLVTQAAAQTPHFPHCQHLFRYWVLLSQLPEYIITTFLHNHTEWRVYFQLPCLTALLFLILSFTLEHLSALFSIFHSLTNYSVRNILKHNYLSEHLITLSG